MPSPNRNTGRPTGRPYIAEYDRLTKACERCGSEFGLRDKRFQSRARFEQRRFCSPACSATAGKPPESFWSRVNRAGDGECWEWQGPLYRNGYGAISINGIKTRAHRYSFELHKGPIPAGKMILHSCDNRRCVNPAHLRPGTAKDNIQDAIARGRIGKRAGS
jgi:hypothetical protein